MPDKHNCAEAEEIVTDLTRQCVELRADRDSWRRVAERLEREKNAALASPVAEGKTLDEGDDLRESDEPTCDEERVGDVFYSGDCGGSKKVGPQFTPTGHYAAQRPCPGCADCRPERVFTEEEIRRRLAAGDPTLEGEMRQAGIDRVLRDKEQI